MQTPAMTDAVNGEVVVVKNVMNVAVNVVGGREVVARNGIVVGRAEHVAENAETYRRRHRPS